MNVERVKLSNLLSRLAEEWRRWIAKLTNPARATAVQGPAEKAEFAAIIEEANREFVLTTKVLLRYLADPGASERYRGGGIPYGWQMSHRHNDGSNLSFFDGHSKWAKRQWLEANPQIFHPDSTRLP